MIGREEAGSLVLRNVGSGAEHHLPLDGRLPRYASVDPTGTLVAMSAIEPGGRGSSFAYDGYANEGRLFVSPLAEPSWKRLDPRLGFDPAWFGSSDRVAFATISGPAVADLATGAVRRRRVGPSALAPSISVNPGGTRIAFFRQRGGGSKLAIWDLQTDEVADGPNCRIYSWFDDDRILFQHGTGPRLLDMTTGRATRWASVCRLGDLARSVAPVELEPVPSGWAIWETVAGFVDLPARIGDRIYYLAGYERRTDAPGPRVGCGLFSVDPELASPAVHGWWDGVPPSAYAVLAAGDLFWASWTSAWAPGEQPIRRTTFFGPKSVGLDQSWRPLTMRGSLETGDPFSG